MKTEGIKSSKEQKKRVRDADDKILTHSWWSDVSRSSCSPAAAVQGGWRTNSADTAESKWP